MDWPAQGQVQEWFDSLKDSEAQTCNDDPNYWIADPRRLYCDSHIENLVFGTGHSIYTKTIIPAIAAAEKEVILVTCFWARSKTLDALNAALIDLSAKALRRGKKIRVRICVSSFSFLQKVFHTSSLSGQRYTPHEWRKKFGLPDPSELEGLEMEVKTIFVLPFSVMHPKFVIVDRTRALLPSCNVSWENWFEGCVTMRDQVVQNLVEFWLHFWARGEDLRLDADGDAFESAMPNRSPPDNYDADRIDETLPWWSKTRIRQNNGRTLSLLLPSPHHRNPQFSLLPWNPCPPPPPTPLNTFLLSAFRNARRDIYIQTPNLTAPPVLSALLEALKCGVSVTIVTSERLMILEQLVTAGTTTKRSLNRLVKRHKMLLRDRKIRLNDWTTAEVSSAGQPGRLQVFFYQPDPQTSSSSEPVQSHLKLVNIDDEWTIFGSGNMDRASWYTSQELGVAFWSNKSGERFTEVAQHSGSMLREIMRRRKKCMYDGSMDV